MNQEFMKDIQFGREIAPIFYEALKDVPASIAKGVIFSTIAGLCEQWGENPSEVLAEIARMGEEAVCWYVGTAMK